jgi:hypothetical protein
MLEWILRAAVGVALAFFSAFGVPYLKEKWGNEKAERITRCVKTAVQAAEQLFGAQTGSEKYNFVCESLQKQGIAVTETTKLQIESAVREL